MSVIGSKIGITQASKSSEVGNIWRFVKQQFPRRFVGKLRRGQPVYEMESSGNSIGPIGCRQTSMGK